MLLMGEVRETVVRGNKPLKQDKDDAGAQYRGEEEEEEKVWRGLISVCSIKSMCAEVSDYHDTVLHISTFRAGGG